MPPKTKSQKSKPRALRQEEGDNSEDLSSCSSLLSVIDNKSDSDTDSAVDTDSNTVAARRRGGGKKGRNNRQRCGNGKLDINVCSLVALKKAGVPMNIAQKIGKYRKKHKCFVHINELMRIQGIKAEVFTLLSKLVAVRSNTEQINNLLKRRKKPAASKSTAKASKSKVATNHTNKSPKRGRKSRSTTNTNHEREESTSRSSRLIRGWPRGSASLSSVVTMSPKANREGDLYKTRSSRSCRFLKYNQTIPSSRSGSPSYKTYERSPTYKTYKRSSTNKTHERSPTYRIRDRSPVYNTHERSPTSRICDRSPVYNTHDHDHSVRYNKGRQRSSHSEHPLPAERKHPNEQVSQIRPIREPVALSEDKDVVLCVIL